LSSFKGTRVTRLGNRVYQNVITDQVDPHGKPYFWIGGQGPTWSRNEGSDYNATQDGFVSLTALMVDLTHYGLLQEMKTLERDGVE
nr:5'/3'-nucleotidase SurE [Candidatus Krumholzibacteria bacterium]